MDKELICIEHSDKYKYDVYVDKEYRHKYFRSPEANYNFDIKTGMMLSWGKTLEDDAVKFPAPNILDMEIDEHCTGLKNDGVTCKFCFPSGTKVTMADNTKKNIEDIKIGDSVSSFDLDSQEYRTNIVKNIYERDYDDILIDIELEDGTIISTTPNHPFFVENKGWVEAKDLDTDTELVLKD